MFLFFIAVSANVYLTQTIKFDTLYYKNFLIPVYAYVYIIRKFKMFRNGEKNEKQKIEISIYPKEGVLDCDMDIYKWEA
jgi:hypothetical protein